MHNLKIVVRKTDGPKCQRCKHRNPDKWIGKVRPQQSRHQDGNRDQQSAHGRRARFFLMRLRPLFANVLPDLEIAQPLNHDRPHDQAREKRGEAGKGSAKRQITKNAERREIMIELQVEQPVEQSASDTSCQLSAVSSQFLAPAPKAWEDFCQRHFFFAKSPAPFPASRPATLSAIRHRRPEPRAPATRPLLPESRRIPLSSPPREPLPPSPLPSP